MEWVKLYATPSYYLDPALARAGEAAEVLFCRALAYCGNVESQGIVDKTALPRLVARPGPRASALVREGLWTDEGTHYLIRSWARLQDEHDAAAERRRRDRERKRAVRKTVRGQSTDASAGSPGDVSADDAECPALDVEGDVEREKTLASQVPAPTTTAKPKARKVKTYAPDQLPLTPAMREWGEANAPLVTGPVAETAKFLDHHRAKGSQFLDWTAAWRTWMANAQTYAERDGGRHLRAVSGGRTPIDRSRPDEPWNA